MKSKSLVSFLALGLIVLIPITGLRAQSSMPANPTDLLRIGADQQPDLVDSRDLRRLRRLV
jgi:hypothetical protein